MDLLREFDACMTTFLQSWEMLDKKEREQMKDTFLFENVFRKSFHVKQTLQKVVMTGPPGHQTYKSVRSHPLDETTV